LFQYRLEFENIKSENIRYCSRNDKKYQYPFPTDFIVFVFHIIANLFVSPIVDIAPIWWDNNNCVYISFIILLFLQSYFSNLFHFPINGSRNCTVMYEQKLFCQYLPYTGISPFFNFVLTGIS